MSTIFITVTDLEDIEVRVNVEKIMTLCEIDRQLTDDPVFDPFVLYGKHTKICMDGAQWIRVKETLDEVQHFTYHAQWDHQRDLATWWKAVPNA